LGGVEGCATRPAFKQLPRPAFLVGGLFILTGGIIIATASTQSQSAVEQPLARENAPRISFSSGVFR
jgi:hypothetical protein